jgi:penicillin-binding protein 2
LRGENGFKLIQVDAFGRQVDLGGKDHSDWDLPVVTARKGADIELTIDYDLQRAANDAFKGKYGAVVAINPKNGEILAMISEPGYDPAIYQRSLSAEEWNSLINNPFKPLFDKTTGGEYIPGSIYKSVVAIAALEEGVIDLNTSHVCNGRFTLGDQTFQCWEKRGHGRVTLREALMKSCDVFFYQVGVEVGVDRIAKYAKAFGLGQRLGVALNMERPGLVPTAAWKKTTFGTPWAGGDTPNIAIGQGYNLLTPVQMVSLYAAIANGGQVWRPFLVKRVANAVGEIVKTFSPELITEVKDVKPQTLKIIREMLQNVVMNPEGTGKSAAVPDATVAGKTGSAQVVSLKKNSNNKNDDISVKWKEHAIFTAFSPTEDAEIAIAIVSENDAIGGGGAQAAPIAGKIIKAYWDLKKKRSKTPITVGIKPEEKKTDERQN